MAVVVEVLLTLMVAMVAMVEVLRQPIMQVHPKMPVLLEAHHRVLGEEPRAVDQVVLGLVKVVAVLDSIPQLTLWHRLTDKVVPVVPVEQMAM
jgi:hypothetical protein